MLANARKDHSSPLEERESPSLPLLSLPSAHFPFSSPNLLMTQRRLFGWEPQESILFKTDSQVSVLIRLRIARHLIRL